MQSSWPCGLLTFVTGRQLTHLPFYFAEMADDIDDLLDEVESKYVKDRSKEPRSSNTKPQRL